MKYTRYRNMAVQLLLGLSVMGATSYTYAQTIGLPIPQTELQKLMNETVKSRIVIYQPKVILLDGGAPSLVASVEQDSHYRLSFSIRNTGSELTFEKVQLRVQGEADEVEFFSDCSFSQILPLDYQGKPAIPMDMNFPLSSRGTPILEGCFVALKDMASSKLRFKVGVYATISPEGHSWQNMSPNP